MKIYYVKSYILLLTDLMHKHTFAWDLGVIVYQITVAVTPQFASQALLLESCSLGPSLLSQQLPAAEQLFPSPILRPETYSLSY